jgi:hypothetical protein
MRVMMNGRSETKITGPRRDLVVLLTARATDRPRTRTKGSVTKVNIRVKRKARQKSMAISAR